jgi:hypothetical protein
VEKKMKSVFNRLSATYNICSFLPGIISGCREAVLCFISAILKFAVSPLSDVIILLCVPFAGIIKWKTLKKSGKTQINRNGKKRKQQISTGRVSGYCRVFEG